MRVLSCVAYALLYASLVRYAAQLWLGWAPQLHDKCRAAQGWCIAGFSYTPTISHTKYILILHT